MLLFGSFQAIALAAFVIPAREIGGLATIYGVVAASAAMGGMATAALYTIMMDRSSRATAATDFTLQQSLAAIGPVIAASSSGFSVAAIGYGGHFLVATTVQVAVVIWAATSFCPRRHPP